jgi:lipoprotein-anchoring transpeptidase ErfK/SrfK
MAGAVRTSAEAVVRAFNPKVGNPISLMHCQLEWNVAMLLRARPNVRQKLVRLGFVLLGLAVLSLPLVSPAEAQWRNYSGYQAYPAYPPYPYPGYPLLPPEGYSVYEEYPPVRRPRGRRGRTYDQSYQPEYDTPYGPHAYRQANPADLELGINRHEATATVVAYPTSQPRGTIVVDTRSRHLYLVDGAGRAIQYGIGVGRQGFEWHGVARVGRKAEWPRWIPPQDMLRRRPDLPDEMAGGLDNPLGARALYLFKGNKDTLFRIHGTNEPHTIGQAVSSGCIRMMNADAIDLYERVAVGTKVVVL